MAMKTVLRVVTPMRLVLGYIAFVATMLVVFAVSLSRGSGSSRWYFVTIAVATVLVAAAEVALSRARRKSN